MAPFVLLLLVAWTLLALGTLFLRRTGETRPVAEVVARQLRDGGLYGEALRDNRRRYKLALYSALKPDVVAIGSSRAQEFRSEFFTSRFANLSGGILTFDEADSFLDAMLAGDRPKVAVFAIDYWWFDTRRESNSVRMDFDTRSESDLSPGDRLLPARWLVQKKFLASAMMGALTLAPADGAGPSQGALALLDHTGFRPDGSWNWTSATTAAPGHVSQEFVPAPSPPGQPLYDAPRLAHLATLVHRLQAAGVAVVMFIPPEMAQSVKVHRDQAAAFPVFTALHDALTRTGAQVFDFEDAATVGGADCEFIDMVHAGEVLGARMLQVMAAKPGSPMAAMVDRVRLKKAIARWHGHAQIMTPAEQARYRESDFLGLGCRK
jgi:hypothetical protein